jgi:hypothetical protein
VDFDRFTEEALMVLWFTRQAVGDTGGEAITPDCARHAIVITCSTPS